MPRANPIKSYWWVTKVADTGFTSVGAGSALFVLYDLKRQSEIVRWKWRKKDEARAFKQYVIDKEGMHADCFLLAYERGLFPNIIDIDQVIEDWMTAADEKRYGYIADDNDDQEYQPRWVLVDKNGKPVKLPIKKRSRGETWTITGFEPPRHEGSSGRINCENKAKGWSQQFFPHVFDLKIVDENVT